MNSPTAASRRGLHPLTPLSVPATWTLVPAPAARARKGSTAALSPEWVPRPRAPCRSRPKADWIPDPTAPACAASLDRASAPATAPCVHGRRGSSGADACAGRPRPDRRARAVRRAARRYARGQTTAVESFDRPFEIERAFERIFRHTGHQRSLIFPTREALPQDAARAEPFIDVARRQCG